MLALTHHVTCKFLADSRYLHDCKLSKRWVEVSHLVALLVSSVPTRTFHIKLSSNAKVSEGCPVLPSTVQGEFGTPISPMAWHQEEEDVHYYPMESPSVGLCPSCLSHPSVPKGRTDSEGTSHGVPSVGLCPSCPSHPLVPKGRTDSKGTSHGVPSVGLWMKTSTFKNEPN